MQGSRSCRRVRRPAWTCGRVMSHSAFRVRSWGRSDCSSLTPSGGGGAGGRRLGRKALVEVATVATPDTTLWSVDNDGGGHADHHVDRAVVETREACEALALTEVPQRLL